MKLSVDLFKEVEVWSTYQPSVEDATKVSYIQRRLEAMKSNRTAADRNWRIYQDMIEAIFTPYPDERSASTVPLASAMIELFVADALRLETQYNFKGDTSKYATQAKTIEHLWKYDFRKKSRKKEFVKDEYVAAGIGTSMMMVSFDKVEKKQYELSLNSDDEPTRQEKAYIEQGILVSSIDIRQAFVDNECIEWIDDASDFILIKRVSYDQFVENKGNKMYKNMDKVKPKEYSNENKPFTSEEENTKQGQYVQEIHYWNVVKDAYMVVANGVLVREHPMTTTIDGKKALPIMLRGFGYKGYSIYHRGLCEGLLMFNSEINNLREMIMDAIRRSNTQVLALGGGLKFNGRGFAYDNEVLTFDWPFAGNFQQISWNPPNSAIFEYMTQIYKDIAIYVGIDVQNIMGEPQQTAFQTEVQRAASQKRINVWLTNRDLAYERFANLYKDALQTYGHIIYPELEIEWEKLVGTGKNAKYKKTKGKETIQITPELLQWDVNIDVYTNTTAPTIQAVDREQKLDFLTRAWTIAQNYAAAKQAWFDLESIMPFKKVMQDIADDSNIDITEWTEAADMEAEKKMFVDKLKQMMPMNQQNAQMQAEQQPAAQPLPSQPQWL